MKRPFLGLDIGTTSISLVVLDVSSADILWVMNRPHHALIPDAPTDAYMLDPHVILSVAREFVEQAYRMFPSLQGLGVTGQMHGIVLIDAEGKAVSPAYTWLDMRARRIGHDGRSHLSAMKEQLGEDLPPGYGAATLYALDRSDDIEKTASSFCTLPDYVALQLAYLHRPQLDSTMAHSMGFFDMDAGQFHLDIWKRISSLSPPSVACPVSQIGLLHNRIPVISAIGDNQASFLASVRDPAHAILINIGTSGQVAVRDEGVTHAEGLDLRPLPGGGKLLVGASLAGGKSFELLANLIRDVGQRMGSNMDPYDIISQGPAVDTSEEGRLIVETTFYGTRTDPGKKGSIRNITAENFTLDNLYRGFAGGIVAELEALLGRHKQLLRKPGAYVAVSGNAVKKNIVLREFLRDRFQVPLMRPRFRESAASGAAMVAASVVDQCPLEELIRRVLQYDEY